jgi:hypothetical protein
MLIPQQAIRVTRDNVSAIADSLIDYSAQDILDDCNYMLERSINVILVRFIHEPGVHTVSHIVSESMFYANARPVAELNDQTFVTVEQL